jgi:hypothetical protein
MKERTRCTVHSMPYKCLPNMMMKHIVLNSVYWLNAFPSKNGISNMMSPSSIVLGTPSPDCKHLKLRTGAYVQLYVGTTNTSKARTVGVIALRRSNENGGYYFMSLKTGCELHGYEWTELPIDGHIISRVEEMAEAEGQPAMANGPIFEWIPGVPILDDDEDEEEINEAIDALEHEHNIDTENNEDSEEDDASEGSLSNEPDDSDDDDTAPDGVVTQSENETDENASVTSNEETMPDETDDSDSEEQHDEARSARPRRQNAGAGVSRLQPVFGGKSYDTQFASVDQRNEVTSADDCYNITVNVVFTQMSATKGIKIYGERALTAMFTEYEQLENLEVFQAVNPDNLTQEDKRKALRAINLIKEKRSGKIKGRAVADGSKTRKYIPREKATSPTIATTSLFTSLVIDTQEGRAVHTFDIPGAYLHAKLPKNKQVLLKLIGEFVDIMFKVNPEYLPYVRFEFGKKVLYLRVLKAIYGMIESALLWYELFSTTLEKMGFEINP